MTGQSELSTGGSGKADFLINTSFSSIVTAIIPAESLRAEVVEAFYGFVKRRAAQHRS